MKKRGYIKLKTKITKRDFPIEKFKELKKLPKNAIGSSLERIPLHPKEVFELLEFLYGPYEDLSKDFVFIDAKNTWERFFRTKNGILRVYDHRGLSSIGYSGELTKRLKSDAKLLFRSIERTAKLHKKIKREALRVSIKTNPLGNFMRTFGAALVLLTVAELKESFFEALVLYASLVDALLRIAITLNRQILNGNQKVDVKFIYQGNSKVFVSERKIFEIALSEHIISKSVFTELSRLYDLRNQAIHRYFISNFEYANLVPLLARYRKIYKIIGSKVSELEHKQVKLGVGMTTKEHLELDDEIGKRITEETQLKLDSQKPVVTIPKRKHIDWEDPRIKAIFKSKKI